MCQSNPWESDADTSTNNNTTHTNNKPINTYTYIHTNTNKRARELASKQRPKQTTKLTNACTHGLTY